MILIPLAAVSGTFAQPVVRVLNSNGGLDERPVTLGDSDDFWTVVESGLAEGDQIVMQSAEASAGGLFGSGGDFRFRGQFSGGFPGGGFGGGGGFGRRPQGQR